MSKRCSSKEVGERKGGFQAEGRACAKALRQKDLGTFKAGVRGERERQLT